MCVCASAMFVNAISYSVVLVVRLAYTSTKTCIKNEWHDYGEYIYPLSCAKVMHFPSAFHCNVLKHGVCTLS